MYTKSFAFIERWFTVLLRRWLLTKWLFKWFLPACVLELIEIDQSTGRQLHLLRLCRACIVQVSENLFVAANMMIECHHIDLLNSCCWFLLTQLRIQVKFDRSVADFCCWMWILCNGRWQTWSMLLLFVSILNIFLYTAAEFSFAIDSVSLISFKAQIPHSMPIRASGRPGLVQALGFKCIIFDAELATRRRADCHRLHPACSVTTCADPSNMWSLSLPARSDVSVGLLRQHSAAQLGTCVILHRKYAYTS